jgi:hypothetical protein
MGSKIEIVDEIRKESVTIDYAYGGGNSLKQAINYLKNTGFKVLGNTVVGEHDMVLCAMDNHDWKGNN